MNPGGAVMIYNEVDDREKLHRVMEEYLDDYNSMTKKVIHHTRIDWIRHYVILAFTVARRAR